MINRSTHGYYIGLLPDKTDKKRWMQVGHTLNSLQKWLGNFVQRELNSFLKKQTKCFWLKQSMIFTTYHLCRKSLAVDGDFECLCDDENNPLFQDPALPEIQLSYRSLPQYQHFIKKREDKQRRQNIASQVLFGNNQPIPIRN